MSFTGSFQFFLHVYFLESGFFLVNQADHGGDYFTLLNYKQYILNLITSRSCASLGSSDNLPGMLEILTASKLKFHSKILQN